MSDFSREIRLEARAGCVRGVDAAAFEMTAVGDRYGSRLTSPPVPGICCPQTAEEPAIPDGATDRKVGGLELHSSDKGAAPSDSDTREADAEPQG